MDTVQATIATNYVRLLARIADAARRTERAAESVRLVAVTKYARLEWVRALADLGQCDFGESRPQQLAERVAALNDDSIRWHLIGHLQSNKVRKLLPQAALVHSVDSTRLLSRIDQAAGELEMKPRVLLEVNVSGEESKDGFDPRTLRNDWAEIERLPHVEVAGLMTMAPLSDDVERARHCFRGLRELRDELAAGSPLKLPELSMGMSGDFEVAIEEGATLVRIGSSLFEGLGEAEAHG